MEAVERGAGEAGPAEAVLLQEARRRDPRDLLRWGLSLLHELVPQEMVAEEERRHRRRYLAAGRRRARRSARRAGYAGQSLDVEALRGGLAQGADDLLRAGTDAVGELRGGRTHVRIVIGLDPDSNTGR